MVTPDYRFVAPIENDSGIFGMPSGSVELIFAGLDNEWKRLPDDDLVLVQEIDRKARRRSAR